MSNPLQQVRVGKPIMEKGCLFQIQKWRNSSVTTKHHHVHHQRPRHYRRIYGNTMKAFLMIACVTMSCLLMSPCSAERISENGQEDVGRRVTRSGGSSGNPCLPEEYLASVKTSFQKLIPTFNSRSHTIQLKTDSRVQIGPEDPSLVPFLQSYYSTALRQIAASKSSTSLSSSEDEKAASSAMFLYFNKEYTRFLLRIGVPLSCISYFMGVVDSQAMTQLQQLTSTLQKRYLPHEDKDSGFKCLFAEGQEGSEIMDTLRIPPHEETFTPSTYLQDSSRDAATCEQMILYMRDGSVMAKMPKINIERKELAIPYLNSPIQLGQLDVPYQIGRYIATGLKCLEDNGQRWNFTCSVVEWMKNDVVSQIVQKPVCQRGFGGILPFILSVQDYSESLHNLEKLVENNSSIRTTSISNALSMMSELDQAISVTTHSNIRKRRSVEVDSQKSEKTERKSRQSGRIKSQRRHKKRRKSRPRHPSNKKDQDQQGQMSNSPNKNWQGPGLQGQSGPNRNMEEPGVGQSQVVITNKYHGKHAEEKRKYDEELLHLYNKLNDHFQHNHMRISRLDVIRDRENQAPKATAFPPIYYHLTTIRPHHRKLFGPPPTTPTTTTTTPEPTTQRKRVHQYRQKGKAQPQPPPETPEYTAVPVGNLKINAEVYLDENRFQKPVQVFVSGKKVNAHLNVVPKNHVSMSGDVIHFQENEETSGHLHPVFDLNKYHHPSIKSNHVARPLNLRKHLLYRKQSRDKLPHNPIDNALNSGFQSVSNLAKSILPSVFGQPAQPKPLPKMHKFAVNSNAYPSDRNKHRQLSSKKQIPMHIMEKPSVRKGKNLNPMDRGLEDLIRTDEEIPR